MTILTREAPSRSRRHRAVLPGLAGLGALAGFLLVLALVEHRWAPLVALDDHARDGLHRLAGASAAFVQAMKAVSALGTISVYLVLVLLLAGHLLRQGRRRAAGFAVVAVAVGSLLNTGVKHLVDRARPLLDDPVASAAHSSFPSGHAQGVVVAVGVLLVALGPTLPHGRRRALAAAGLLWALLMGFSRVALGVHYVSDVLGGYLLAVAWLATCLVVFDPPATGTPGRSPRGR